MDFYDKYYDYSDTLKRSREQGMYKETWTMDLWWWFKPKRWSAFQIRIKMGMNYRAAFTDTKSSTRKELKEFIEKS